MDAAMKPLPPPLADALQPYGPDVIDAFARTRDKLRALCPGATEMVYDSYNAVAAAYSFTGQLRDAFCHIAAYTRHVNLGFNRGAELEDPHGLLQGAGKLIRHVRIDATTMNDARIARLIREAAARAPRNGATGEAKTIVRSASPRKRRPGV